MVAKVFPSHSHQNFSAVFLFLVGPLPPPLQTLRCGDATAWAPARGGRDKQQNATLPATTTCSQFNLLNLALFGACCTKICLAANMLMLSNVHVPSPQDKSTSLGDALCSTAAAAARFRAC